MKNYIYNDIETTETLKQSLQASLNFKSSNAVY